MPLINEWSPDAHSLAAIWKIEEDETFFEDSTGLDPIHIKLAKRRLEHLAGRHLLKLLKQDFPLHHIAPDAQDKPRIPQDQYRFSISHSFPYVAVQVSDSHECGIDIQVWHRGMRALQDKFLSPEEQEIFAGNSAYLHLAWCVKEAAYKWNGRRGIDFIGQMQITEFSPSENRYSFGLNFKNDGLIQRLSLAGAITDYYAFAIIAAV